MHGDHKHRRCSTARYLDAVDATFGGTNQQHRRSAARRGLPFASDNTISRIRQNLILPALFGLHGESMDKTRVRTYVRPCCT